MGDDAGISFLDHANLILLSGEGEVATRILLPASGSLDALPSSSSSVLVTSGSVSDALSAADVLWRRTGR